MGEGGFLSRWSRRKRGLEPVAPEPAAPPALEAEAPPAEPEFDLASLPPVESLGPGSDITVFLRPRVPVLLRQAALRRMWSLDPAIRDFTGPAEYAWDFNAPDGVPGFATELSEEVGRRLAQALGGLPPPGGEEAEAPPREAPAAPAEPAEAAMAEVPPPPESSLRLSAAEPSEPALPEPSVEASVGAPEEAAPPPRRRHGGAVPS
ncbi:DUF3306 domain-containing protein [Roseomonas sp. M0104]|uniref:DUF3306 domain-containing protein n=1 Tax=Teichococcus coralli TaxID=2545983 RepID=A0A845BNF3_9PROT|nr:DUF3306 domain-containing protein [Pseudoroseomonas coralli]MXP64929.1 DUF3306 domain-containing protein [Pseudoroseomonas coralli]